MNHFSNHAVAMIKSHNFFTIEHSILNNLPALYVGLSVFGDILQPSSVNRP